MNEVSLEGKVSRSGRLRYTPAGVPTIEFTLAVPQSVLDKASVGYIDVVMFGSQAEDVADRVRVGASIALRGQLWGRRYRNRRGETVTETKVLGERLEPLPQRSGNQERQNARERKGLRT